MVHTITAWKIYLEKLTIGLSFEPCLCSTLSMSTVQSCTNFLESPIFDPCVRYPTPITIIHLLRLATSFLGLELSDRADQGNSLKGIDKKTVRRDYFLNGNHIWPTLFVKIGFCFKLK